VARLQAEQQRLRNQTLTPEALTSSTSKSCGHEGGDNLIILVPTEGGIPVLNIGDLRRNLKRGPDDHVPLITSPGSTPPGGSDIAQPRGARPGWTVVDNEFVDQVARLAGVPAAEVAKQEERAPGLLERLARTLATASPEMFIAASGAPQAQAEETRFTR